MKKQIYDCITFYNANLLFEMRFHTLKNVVDYFVVCEANKDHTGNYKGYNFNPKIYVIYLGINERYYVPESINYEPNPSDISSGKWRGHINDFDNLTKTSLKDQIFDRIKNDSFFLEKGRIKK